METMYYSFEEIKIKFESYRDLKESDITDDEYDRFCSEIQMIPKDIIDEILKGIKFVLLSANPKKVNPACYVNLKKLNDEKKEGIIVLTPYILGAPYIDKNGNEKLIYPYDAKILHEVAHHTLGHTCYKDQKDKDKKEKAADEEVEKWLTKWRELNKVDE